MTYDVHLSKTALNYLKKIPKKAAKKIIDKIESLTHIAHPVGSIKLQGTEFYRIRIGDYRVIYEVDNSILKILVIKVGHRKDVYNF